MAIPSGSGTEVLKRASLHANNGAWTTIITGVANHIYTVISVTASESGGAAETMGIRIDISAAGSNQINIVENSTVLPAKATFTYNDKLVLSGTDKLDVYNSSGNVDWYVSYIDQDWS